MRHVASLSLLSIALLAGLASHASAAGVTTGTVNGSISSFTLGNSGGTTYVMSGFNPGPFSINGVSGQFPVDPDGIPDDTVGDYNVRGYRVTIAAPSLSFDTNGTVAEALNFLQFKFNDLADPVITYNFTSSQVTYVSGILNGNSALFLNLYLLGTLVGTDGTNSSASISLSATNNSGGWTGSYALTVPPSAPPAGHDEAAPEPATLTLFGAGLLSLGFARRKRSNA